MLIVEARKRRYFQIEFDPHQKLPQSKYAEFCILKNCSLCIRTKTRRQTQAPSHIFTKTKENRDKDKQKFLLPCSLKSKTNSGKDEDKQNHSPQIEKHNKDEHRQL